MQFLIDIKEIVEDTVSTIFKMFLFVKIILWYGPFFGIPFFVLAFSCYRILIYKFFKLIAMTPMDICFLSKKNYERYNIIGVIKFKNYEPMKIKEVLIEKAIKRIKRLRMKIEYTLFNYYWKEVSENEAIRTITINEEEIKDLEMYIENEISQYIDIRKRLPYELKLMKYKDECVLLFKFDHILSDGLSIVSLICSLDDNYNKEIYPTIMQMNKKYEMSKLNILIHSFMFIFYSFYSMYIMFFQSSGKTPFKSSKFTTGKINMSIGKSHLISSFNKIRKEKGLTFNEAITSIISNVCYDISSNIKELKCMIPVSRRGIPSELSKIHLVNEANIIYLNLPLIKDLSKNNLSLIQNRLKNTFNNSFLNYSYLMWPKILCNFISFRLINYFSMIYFSNVDLIISNIPGPKRELSYNGNTVKEIYTVVSPGKGVPFITVMSYNDKFIVSLSIDTKLSIDSKDIINKIDYKIDQFINQ